MFLFKYKYDTITKSGTDDRRRGGGDSGEENNDLQAVFVFIIKFMESNFTTVTTLCREKQKRKKNA